MAYQKKYNEKPDNWAAVGYSIGLIAANALKTAGPNPTRSSVRLALEKTKNFPVPLGDGKWTLDENRNPHYGAAVIVVKNGGFSQAD